MTQDAVTGLLAARKGHFLLESGHHGDLWLDLDPLFLHPARLRPLAAALAEKLLPHGVEVMCGPLTGGAFIAQMVAEEMEASGMDAMFVPAERVASPPTGGLYAAVYRIAPSLRRRIAGKRVAVVDDVINAGSATRATLAELESGGAVPAALAALLVLGDRAAQLAADRGLPLESLAALANDLWAPAACPLCAAGVPLENPGASV